MNQVSYLFEYLKKTKQYFYCWIIYYNHQLKLLTVKMMKKYQLKENIQLLNSKYCMIGIFVDREVSINCKKEIKYSFITGKFNHPKQQIEKHTVYSCYQYISTPEMLKKPKTKLKKINQLSRHTQNNYSLKSFNSASKTNSSSLKNQLSQKQSESQLQEHNLSESSNIKANQKQRNFKRKKEKLLLFAEIKTRKSSSTKNQKSKSYLKMFKSLDKISFPTKNSKEINFQNQQKTHAFRSLSNADKFESYKKIDSNKIQFKKGKKQLQFEKNRQKSKSLLKQRRLSKEEKTFSYVSITSNQSQIVESKPIDDKMIPNFKRKISANGVNVKKKKIDPTKFVTSTKNSFGPK